MPLPVLVVAMGWVGLNLDPQAIGFVSTARAAEPAAQADAQADAPAKEQRPPYLKWRTLSSSYDLMRAKATPELLAFNQKRVELRGYMIPLREDAKAVYEFLIVPTQAACEHVAPPPLNQLIHAKAPKGVPLIWGPMVTLGTLTIVEGKAIMKEAPFQLDVEQALNFRRPRVRSLR